MHHVLGLDLHHDGKADLLAQLRRVLGRGGHRTGQNGQPVGFQHLIGLLGGQMMFPGGQGRVQKGFGLLGIDVSEVLHLVRGASCGT